MTFTFRAFESNEFQGRGVVCSQKKLLQGTAMNVATHYVQVHVQVPRLFSLILILFLSWTSSIRKKWLTNAGRCRKKLKKRFFSCGSVRSIVWTMMIQVLDHRIFRVHVVLSFWFNPEYLFIISLIVHTRKFRIWKFLASMHCSIVMSTCPTPPNLVHHLKQNEHDLIHVNFRLFYWFISSKRGNICCPRWCNCCTNGGKLK